MSYSRYLFSSFIKFKFAINNLFSEVIVSDLWKKHFTFSFSVKQVAFYFKVTAVYSSETSLTFTFRNRVASQGLESVPAAM
jgi:hypothetical protein